MTSLCIVADTHRKHRAITVRECDILVHCGDFCTFEQEDRSTLEDVDAWFSEVPAKRVVCIGGNHDFLLESREFRFEHATFLEDSGAEIDGLSIYGAPWCPGLSEFAYYATEDELIEKWRKIPSGVDILITHTPPYEILDVPSSGGTHLGCPHLRKELKRIQPGLHVFGHVHASRGTQIEGATRFVNAAIVGGRNYEVRHTPIGISLFSDDEHQDPMESLQNLDRKTGIRSDALAALQRWSLNLKRTFLGLREAWSLVGGGIAVAILLCVLYPEFRGWIMGILAAFLIIVIFVTSALSGISAAFSYPCGRCGCLGSRFREKGGNRRRHLCVDCAAVLARRGREIEFFTPTK